MGDGSPGFLDLLPRNEKPRSSGLTHVLDKGASPAEIEILLSRAGDAIDL